MIVGVRRIVYFDFYRQWPVRVKDWKPSFCKYPVIAITHVDAVIRIFHFLEKQGIMQLGSHFTGKSFRNQKICCAGNKKSPPSGNPRFYAGWWTGYRLPDKRIFIIENPIGVQSFDFTLQSVEIQVFNGSAQIKSAGRTYLEIASCLSVI